ncbi:MAG TPA: hypothetical protein VD794_16820 [Flavisolibacter sp.]|nr:hypothetical protein [Flavisolibacter sp.]
MKWKLPAPRGFGWQMKTLESAETSFTVLPHGSYEACIEHGIIKGCTPEMIEWWFRHIGGDMEYQGHIYPRYLVWHPIDHIHWALVKTAPGGGARVGAQFRIVEAFNGNIKWLVDTIEEVVKLDHTGMRLRKQFLGLEVYSLEHQFIPHPQGTQYISRMQIGSETLLGRCFLNPFIHRFIMTETMTRAWLKHNIEEVGNFEYFLPALYEKEQYKKAKNQFSL